MSTWNHRSKQASTLALLAAIGHAYPGRGMVVVCCLVIAGVVESIGLVSLIPLLSLLFGDAGATDNRISASARALFAAAGLPLSLVTVLGFIVLAISMKALLKFAAMTYVGYTVSHVTARLRTRLLKALMTAEWAFFVHRPVGTFSNAISSEAGRATAAFMAACNVLSSALQIAIYIAAALMISWQASLGAIAVGVTLMVAFRPTVTRSRSAGKKITEHTASLVARLTDILAGLKPVKAMGLEAHVASLVERETAGLEEAQRRQVMYKWVLSAGGEPIIVSIIATGLYFAVAVGNQAPAAVTVIALLFYRTLNSFNLLQGLLQLVASYEAGYWTVESMIAEAEAVRERIDGGMEPSLERGIEFAGVGFRHGDQAVLEDASFEIPSHGLTAIVGPSGTGKTTTIDLLIGMHQPTAGEVRVGGVPLQHLDQRRWRSMLGYVPQETVLLHDSVLANVLLGQEAISEADAVEALKAAGAWEFVEGLPDGLHTMVGERGQRFSGGQRQRIAIARALARRPALLILDEATAALDPVSEHELCATVRELAKHMPIIAISHQRGMVDIADRVLVAGNRRIERAAPGAPMIGEAVGTS